jgi:tetratricopeptide (TPR) repeat protein
MTSARAYAQSDEREVKARELFGVGKYTEALDLYGKLYAEKGHPTYLRNIGRCYQNLGEPDKAIGSFHEYLRQAKRLSSDQRTVVEGYIHEMEELKAKRQAGAAPTPESATPPAASAPEDAAPPAPITTRKSGRHQARAEEPPGSPRRTVSYVIGGVSLVALGVGAFYGLTAISRNNDSNKLCTNDPCTGQGLSLNQQARSDATIANFTIGAGLVGAAVATYLFITSSDAKVSKPDGEPVAARGLHFLPELGPNQAGLLASGSW